MTRALTGSPLAGVALVRCEQWPTVAELLERHAPESAHGNELFDTVAYAVGGFEAQALGLLTFHWGIT